jgi:hypothetical protein
MWFSERGMQVMSVPDLSVFLPAEIGLRLAQFLADMYDDDHRALVRALDRTVDEVAFEWHETVGDLAGESEFEHALPDRVVSLDVSTQIRSVDDLVVLLEQIDMRWRADVASSLQLHLLGALGQAGRQEGRPGPGEPVSASAAVLRGEPVTGVIRDGDDGEWLFFADGDDWKAGIHSTLTSWAEMLGRDRSLRDVREIGPGQGAWRPEPDSPWIVVADFGELMARRSRSGPSE